MATGPGSVPPDTSSVDWRKLEEARALLAEYDWITQPGWVVYRFLAPGEVLYIGMTNNLARRIKEHQKDKEFLEDGANTVCSILVERCPNEAEARTWERHLIEGWKPTYNIQFNSSAL